MSGGAYEYKYCELNNLADLLDPETDTHQPERKRVAAALRELAKICHDIEWIDSADYGEEDWGDVLIWLDKHGF